MTTINIMKNIQFKKDLEFSLSGSRKLTINGNADKDITIDHDKYSLRSSTNINGGSSFNLKNANIVGKMADTGFFISNYTGSTNIADVTYNNMDKKVSFVENHHLCHNAVTK
ncbi:pectate lyase-like adhesive domain-containing protein [Bacillus cereus group sp. RP43]|uniref:pectate lyase-like adhesive domain-containing protein n=1 Tax=Bacillus cereus group sp. RP43 TaxID=3040260 RepID=UPI0033977B86